MRLRRNSVRARTATSGRPFVLYFVCGFLVDRIREPVPGQLEFDQSAASRWPAVGRRVADILSCRRMGFPRTHGEPETDRRVARAAHSLRGVSLELVSGRFQNKPMTGVTRQRRDFPASP